MSSSRSSGNVVASIVSSAACGTSSRRVLAARVRSRRMRLMARLRAVVTSQAPGLAGTPSWGHRSAAIAKASWVASSARSKSPRKPISAARTRPQWSRKTSSRVVTNTSRWADLDGATQAGRWDPRGQLDRRIQIVGLQDSVAADRLLDLDERAVGGQRLAVLHPHGGGVLGKPHRQATGEAGRLVDLRPLGVDALLLVLRPRRREAGAVVDQQHVLHGSLLLGDGHPEDKRGTAKSTAPDEESRQSSWRWTIARLVLAATVPSARPTGRGSPASRPGVSARAGLSGSRAGDAQQGRTRVASRAW